MNFISMSKIALVVIFPFFLFLAVVNFAVFDNGFYEKKFVEYGIQENVNDPSSLHKKVMDFIRGYSGSLPDEFNQREKEHFLDVKNLADAFTILFYAVIFAFVILLVISGALLKINSRIINFIGKILMFGGFVTVLIGLVLFALISSDFQSAFGSFHRVFFEQGTYLFDPSSEGIVRLYPEQIFMDLGFRISGWVLALSILAIIIGFFLILKTKRKK